MNDGAGAARAYRRPVLFVGYWGLHDALTAASIMPGVRLMVDEFHVPKVILATVERDGHEGPSPLHGDRRVEHLPWREKRIGPKVIARALDHAGRVRQLVRAVRREQAGMIFARTAPAAVAAYAAARITGLPLVVESFEPHADYMADCGEWSRGGAMYRLVHRQERRVIAGARFLITVAHSYRERLIQEGVDAGRVLVAPCPVPLDRFTIDEVARARVRRELGLGDAFTGVYAGKFGGLYHRETAYATFKKVHDHFDGRFRLIVLTPDPVDQVRSGLQQAGYPLDHAVVTRASHDQVPDHLNAADMAFALYKRTPSSVFLSPVKVGEYWACGLPVLLTRGVADDGAIIEGGQVGGALFDPEGNDLGPAIERITKQLDHPDGRSHNRALAARHRSLEHTRVVYGRVFADLGNNIR